MDLEAGLVYSEFQDNQDYIDRRSLEKPGKKEGSNDRRVGGARGEKTLWMPKSPPPTPARDQCRTFTLYKIQFKCLWQSKLMWGVQFWGLSRHN